MAATRQLPALLGCTPACMGVIPGLLHKEKRRVRLFENRVLSKIFGTDRNEAPGVWRILRKGLRDAFSLPSGIQIKEYVACDTCGRNKCIQNCDWET